ncbi:MAG TPA: protein phosphatase 2C domain-containing protein [Cellvibrionaceae bacterium]
MKNAAMLESSSLTNPGRKRSNNEDCFLSLPEHALWMVADGMGGHEAGEVASAIVRQTLQEHPSESLQQSIQAAHQAVLRAASDGVGAEGMGSTVVALKDHGKGYEIAWVGDSRAYGWIPGSGLQQLTTDHSYVQMLLQSGAIDPSDASNHPDKNIITQCLGSRELDVVEVDIVRGQWQPEQWILLCSDGLTDELSDQDISRILKAADTPATAARELMAAALSSGGRDNITLQVIAAPTQQHSLLERLLDWVPIFTVNRRWDAAIYGAAIVTLVALLYWTVFR